MTDRPVIDFDSLLDALAERVAVKLADRLARASDNGTKPRLLSVEDAALYLGRSKTGVQHLIAAGAVPVVRSDRRVFLDRKDLDQWIERNKS